MSNEQIATTSQPTPAQLFAEDAQHYALSIEERMKIMLKASKEATTEEMILAKRVAESPRFQRYRSSTPATPLVLFSLEQSSKRPATVVVHGERVPYLAPKKQFTAQWISDLKDYCRDKMSFIQHASCFAISFKEFKDLDTQHTQTQELEDWVVYAIKLDRLVKLTCERVAAIAARTTFTTSPEGLVTITQAEIPLFADEKSCSKSAMVWRMKDKSVRQLTILAFSRDDHARATAKIALAADTTESQFHAICKDPRYVLTSVVREAKLTEAEIISYITNINAARPTTCPQCNTPFVGRFVFHRQCAVTDWLSEWFNFHYRTETGTLIHQASRVLNPDEKYKLHRVLKVHAALTRDIVVRDDDRFNIWIRNEDGTLTRTATLTTAAHQVVGSSQWKATHGLT